MQMSKHKRTRILLKEAAFIMAFLLSFNSCFFYVSSYAASSTDLVYENDYTVDDGLKDDGSVSENEALIDDTVSENMLTDSKKVAAYDEDSDIEIAIDDLTDEDYPADNEDLFAAYFDSLVKESLQDKDTSGEELNNESRIMSIGDPDRALYDSLNEYERPIYDALSRKITDIASGKTVDTQLDISLAQVGTDKEADAFLYNRDDAARKVSVGVAMCIFSPVLLLVLSAALKAGTIALPETTVTGIGLCSCSVTAAPIAASPVSRSTEYRFTETSKILAICPSSICMMFSPSDTWLSASLSDSYRGPSFSVSVAMACPPTADVTSSSGGRTAPSRSRSV